MTTRQPQIAPDVTLQDIYELIHMPRLNKDQTEELVERVTELDQWLSNGGALPSPWLKGRM